MYTHKITDFKTDFSHRLAVKNKMKQTLKQEVNYPTLMKKSFLMMQVNDSTEILHGFIVIRLNNEFLLHSMIQHPV